MGEIRTEGDIVNEIKSSLRVGQTKWFTETFPEGPTVTINKMWTGKEWVIAEDQDYPGTATDIRNFRQAKIG